MEQGEREREEEGKTIVVVRKERARMNPVSFGEEPEIFGWILSPLTTNVCLLPIVHEKDFCTIFLPYTWWSHFEGTLAIPRPALSNRRGNKLRGRGAAAPAFHPFFMAIEFGRERRLMSPLAS